MIFTGRVVVITGGGTGIGEAMALAMAEKEATVIVTGRKLESLQEVAEKSHFIHGHTMDVTDQESVVAGFKMIEAEYGPVDILFANAGVISHQPIHRIELGSWKQAIDTNLTGPMLCIQQVWSGMIGREFGRIIITASMAAFQGAPLLGGYTASKHGVMGLVKSAATELLSRNAKGVTINAICPGFTVSPMVNTGVERLIQGGMDKEAAWEKMRLNNPMGEIIPAGDVAKTGMWLCDMPMISGVGIPINAGHSV